MRTAMFTVSGTERQCKKEKQWKHEERQWKHKERQWKVEERSGSTRKGSGRSMQGTGSTREGGGTSVTSVLSRHLAHAQTDLSVRYDVELAHGKALH